MYLQKCYKTHFSQITFILTAYLNSDALENLFDRKPKTSGPFPSMIRWHSSVRKAKRYFSKKEISDLTIFNWNHTLLQDYEATLRSTHGIPSSNVYKYPKCRHFKQVIYFKHSNCEVPNFTLILNFQVPTDSGICHTFNGVALSKILKPSSWFSDFRWY